MPRRRPPGAGPAFSTKLLSLALVLPWISAAAQQQQPQERAHGRSPREPGGVHTILPPSHGRLDKAAGRRSHTPIQASNEFAVATVSSAPADNAVRAHPGPNAASNNGLTPSRARSIHDWKIEDFVLLVTVDGHIHARSRYTGDPMWELDVGKPMLETIYSTPNNTDPVDAWRNKHFLWIVEPKEDGALYILTPGPYPVLQSLDLTVKQLTDDMNPYSSEDPPVVYTAEKRSLMLVVDAREGKVTKSFSPSGSMSIDDPERCHTQAPEYFLTNEQRECRGYFNLGLTEYIVTIHNKNTGDHICTIKYSEWTPNNRDRDLQSQYHQPMDELYLHSRYNGELFAYDHRRSNWVRNHVYRKFLNYPVARVFDIASRNDDEDPDPALVLLPQPPGRDIEPDSIKHVWLNTTDGGSWYAMSERNYPAVTKNAPQASCYRHNDYVNWDDPHILPERNGLVGVHVLDYLREPPPTFGAIAGPTHSNSGDHGVSIPAEIPVAHPTVQPSDPQPKKAIEAHSLRWTVLSLPMLFALLLCAIAYVRHDVPLRKWLAKNVIKSTDAEQPFAPDRGPEVIVAVDPPAEAPKVESKPEQEIVQDIVPDMTPTSEETEKKKVKFDVPIDDEEDLTLSRTTTIEAPSTTEAGTEMSESLTLEDTVQAKINGVEDNPQDQSGALLTPKKKKTHRGKRGGQKSRNRKPKEGDEIDQIVEAAKQLNQTPPMHPDEATIVNGDDVQDVSNIKKIGKLTIDFDRVLGNGSGGTFVFEGKWNVSYINQQKNRPAF